MLAVLVAAKGGNFEMSALAALAVAVGSLLGLAVVRLAEEYTTYPVVGE